MTTSSLIINGKDALAEWGIVPLSNLIGELFGSSSGKRSCKNTSRLEHGSRFLSYPGGRTILASRDLTLDLRIRPLPNPIFGKVQFRDTRTGIGLAINIHRQAPGLVFKCVYLSCSQYSQYNGNVAKFILRLNEPNPANRS